LQQDVAVGAARILQGPNIVQRRGPDPALSSAKLGFRIYVYPMTAADLQEWLKSASVTGWEWSETNAWVSASQLRRAPPPGHMFVYLLASGFLVPMRVPMEA
jgi:hypothetical protein